MYYVAANHPTTFGQSYIAARRCAASPTFDRPAIA
jgi:hypothetical protein